MRLPTMDEQEQHPDLDWKTEKAPKTLFDAERIPKRTLRARQPAPRCLTCGYLIPAFILRHEPERSTCSDVCRARTHVVLPWIDEA